MNDARIDIVDALTNRNNCFIQTAPNLSMQHPANYMLNVHRIMHLEQVTDMPSVHPRNWFKEL